MKELFKALSAFQKEVPTIHKGTEGYGYSYADLPTIFEKINPILEKHKLGFTQLVTEQGIKTILFHEDVEATLESITPIPQGVQLKGMNDFQVLGSAITYIRRYALSSMLGLVTDKDTDASGEQKPSQAKKQSKDDKPWFNPTTKKGDLTESGESFIQYAIKVGKDKALTDTQLKYKVSSSTKDWVMDLDLMQYS